MVNARGTLQEGTKEMAGNLKLTDAPVDAGGRQGGKTIGPTKLPAKVGTHPAKAATEDAPPLAVEIVLDVADAFIRVFEGNVANTLTPGGVSQRYCEEVRQRFEHSSARKERRDGVPGYEVGATQFDKTAEEYMSSVDTTGDAIRQILGGHQGEVAQLMRNIGKRLAARGIFLRPLIHLGEPAPIGRLVRWSADAGEAKWLLRPHEDKTQTAGYPTWELSNVDHIVAINIYLSSKAGSGQLAVTGWRPSDDDRRDRGIEKSGYPYPDADLLQRPHLVLPVATGDVCCIDGAAVHAVLIGEGKTADRLFANIFVGRIGRNTAVYWA